MDLESVRLFVLAAERLNISAAGRELDLAPAVASARLAKLEHTLGADLLRRSTRKVTLSLEGAEFLPFAREMLAQEAAAHPEDRLVIAFPDDGAAKRFGRAFKPVSQQLVPIFLTNNRLFRSGCGGKAYLSHGQS